MEYVLNGSMSCKIAEIEEVKSLEVQIEASGFGSTGIKGMKINKLDLKDSQRVNHIKKNWNYRTKKNFKFQSLDCWTWA